MFIGKQFVGLVPIPVTLATEYIRGVRKMKLAERHPRKGTGAGLDKSTISVFDQSQVIFKRWKEPKWEFISFSYSQVRIDLSPESLFISLWFASSTG
jgi:hypothetical protein